VRACACLRSSSDIGAIFLHVPRDKARRGEITRGETNTHVRELEEERQEETDGTRGGKIEMENERVEYKREDGREKKRPEIKIQSFRPVLHHADEDNGIPRYFLPLHGIFLRVNTRVFFLSLSLSLYLLLISSLRARWN